MDMISSGTFYRFFQTLILFSAAFAVMTCDLSCTSATSKAASPSGAIPAKQLGRFQFAQKYYDFGVIKDGDTVRHAFPFKNVGSSPIIIHDISPSCGCTVVNWTNMPVRPNETGVINVQFYKHHDFGRHSKMIIIKANTAELYTILTIYASIAKPDALVTT